MHQQSLDAFRIIDFLQVERLVSELGIRLNVNRHHFASVTANDFSHGT